MIKKSTGHILVITLLEIYHFVVFCKTLENLNSHQLTKQVAVDACIDKSIDQYILDHLIPRGYDEMTKPSTVIRIFLIDRP